jgi:hypothetical protein
MNSLKTHNMKTKIYLILFVVVLLMSVIRAQGQTKPKTHVFYDTVKNVVQRVDYSPDTIAVWFYEIKVEPYRSRQDDQNGHREWTDTTITNKWTKGFVIWQTYHKSYGFGAITGTTSTMSYIGQGTLTSSQDYYKDEFQPTEFIKNKFLYADKKTPVTNHVLYTILR